MSYSYESHRAWINGPEGTKALAEVMRNISERLDPAGAAMMHRLWPSGAGDSDNMMAAVDRAAELGVIEEVRQASTPWGQHRIFRRPQR